MKKIAIVLAAGKGKRMNSQVAKQFMLLRNKPILYYSLHFFETSDIDEVYLVTSKEECEYCKNEIVEKYGFNKVSEIVVGGKERYHSVYEGIKAITKDGGVSEDDYIYIHDGARPFLNTEMISRLHENVAVHQTAIAAVPCKDTIKVVDQQMFVSSTPNRNELWQIQTPQVFTCSIIKDAYRLLMERESEVLEAGIIITDDAMVVETMLGKKIKLVEGDYKNIKITTPEDLLVAEAFLQV